MPQYKLAYFAQHQQVCMVYKTFYSNTIIIISSQTTKIYTL